MGTTVSLVEESAGQFGSTLADFEDGSAAGTGSAADEDGAIAGEDAAVGVVAPDAVFGSDDHPGFFGSAGLEGDAVGRVAAVDSEHPADAERTVAVDSVDPALGSSLPLDIDDGSAGALSGFPLSADTIVPETTVTLVEESAGQV